MTIMRPTPTFTLHDLIPGDIVEKDSEKRFHGTYPGFKALVIGQPVLAKYNKYTLEEYEIPVMFIETREKGTLVYDEDSLIEDRVIRDGEVIWDYMERL